MREKIKRRKWGRAFVNNGYMLGLIWKACPGVLVFSLANALLGAAYTFLFQTYLYQYALNAFQEGKRFGEILLTIVGMVLFSLVYLVVQEIAARYMEMHTPIVEAHIQNLLQKKAPPVAVLFGVMDYLTSGRGAGSVPFFRAVRVSTKRAATASPVPISYLVIWYS